MSTQRRNWWGWGYEDEKLDELSVARVKAMLQASLGVKAFDQLRPPRLEEIRLRPPRIQLPPRLAHMCINATLDRVSHSYGKSYRDVLRGIKGQFDNPPDFVSYPRQEAEIMELMAFCAMEQIALIPYGGGSSAVGGVEPTTSSHYRGVITVDLKNFAQVLEVNTESRSARVQAGILGPALEAGLKPYNLTLRHFPQSFEFSSLGGWIATRSGGHFATGYTHIDEFVESIRMLTPKGALETRRVPYSGAGPSPERLVLGSEGILGIITEAWMRLQVIPLFRASATVRFRDSIEGIHAVKAISQSGLFPANCRLISPLEALSTGLGDGNYAVLILGFESHDHSLEAWINRGMEICAEFGGQWDDGDVVIQNGEDRGRPTLADRWRKAFLQAPYLRDHLVSLGLMVETFETAITWDHFEMFHQGVLTTVQNAIDTQCEKGFVTWRMAYVYPDGPAPYYTVIALAQRDQEIEQWAKIKAAASDAILAYGGTITHHHAVGKDHRPWYEQERSPLFGNVLANAKQTLDPNWILNPDVLVSVENRIKESPHT